MSNNGKDTKTIPIEEWHRILLTLGATYGFLSSIESDDGFKQDRINWIKEQILKIHTTL